MTKDRGVVENRFDELVRVVSRLRAPGGCAWDAEQTHSSLVQYLIEETYELVEALETGSRDDVIEELGDVLYQVLFHADLAAHTPGELFDIQDVAERVTAKMVGRHPHVFALPIAHTAEDIVAVWDDLKASEKPERTSVLDGIPLGMPSLALAEKLIGRAQKIGVLEKNVEASIPLESEAELGRLLLAVVASAKTQGLDAERALRSTLRSLRGEIRQFETDMSDAGIIAFGSDGPGGQ